MPIIRGMLLLATSFFPLALSAQPDLTTKVEKGDLKIDIEVPGVFVAEDKSEIAIEPKQYKGELIVTRIMPEGSNVDKGDVLMEFDTDYLNDAMIELENSVADAEVELQKALAEFETEKIDAETKLSQLSQEHDFAIRELNSSLELEEINLQKKQREIGNAKRNLKNGKVDFEQLQQLYEERELHTATENILMERQRESIVELEKNIARLEKEFDHFLRFEKAKETFRKKLEVEKKEAELKKQQIRGQANLKEKRSTVDKARRKLEQRIKSVEDLKLDRRSLKVISPKKGVLLYGKTGTSAIGLLFGGRSNPEMRIGGRVKTHEILMTVAAMERLAIKMQVLENDIQHLKKGLAITVRPDAFPALELTGDITAIDQIATRSNLLSEVRRFTVKGQYDGKFSQLRSGMNCRVTIHADNVPDAIQVPIIAVIEESGEYFCFVKNGNQSEKRAVELGRSNNESVQIKAGLLPGETIFLYDPKR